MGQTQDRSWLTIRLNKEGNVVAHLQMIVVPDIGDLVKSNDSIYEVQSVNHTVGISDNDNPYHYIDVYVEEV